MKKLTYIYSIVVITIGVMTGCAPTRVFNLEPLVRLIVLSLTGVQL
jgi:hypothetical protein